MDNATQNDKYINAYVTPGPERKAMVDRWISNINRALQEYDHAVYANSVMLNFFDRTWTTCKWDYDNIFFPVFDKWCEKHNLSKSEREHLLN